MTAKRIGVWLDVRDNHAKTERLLGEGWVVCRHTCTWQPSTDVYEDDGGVVVRVEAAGLRGEDISVTLTGNKLVINGARVDPAPKRIYHQMEIPFGEFRTEIHVPWEPALEQTSVEYEIGFLTIRLPFSPA